MDPNVVAGILRAIAAVAGSGIIAVPALVVQVAGIAATLISMGEKGQEELKALTDQVQRMAASGRNPTAAEWADWKSRSDTAHAVIQAEGSSDA